MEMSNINISDVVTFIKRMQQYIDYGVDTYRKTFFEMTEDFDIKLATFMRKLQESNFVFTFEHLLMLIGREEDAKFIDRTILTQNFSNFNDKYISNQNMKKDAIFRMLYFCAKIWVYIENIPREPQESDVMMYQTIFQRFYILTQAVRQIIKEHKIKLQTAGIDIKYYNIFENLMECDMELQKNIILFHLIMQQDEYENEIGDDENVKGFIGTFSKLSQDFTDITCVN
jgi:hypothetical protein